MSINVEYPLYYDIVNFAEIDKELTNIYYKIELLKKIVYNCKNRIELYCGYSPFFEYFII